MLMRLAARLRQRADNPERPATDLALACRSVTAGVHVAALVASPDSLILWAAFLHHALETISALYLALLAHLRPRFARRNWFIRMQRWAEPQVRLVMLVAATLIAVLAIVKIASGGAHGGTSGSGPVLATAFDFALMTLAWTAVSVAAARQTGDAAAALRREAEHLRLDAVGGLAALAGAGGAQVGIAYVEPVSGLVIALLIGKAAIEANQPQRKSKPMMKGRDG